MPETIQFRCPTAGKAVHTVKTLLGKQVKPSEIKVISSEPIPELHPLITGRSRLPAFVISGAIAGIIGGVLLAGGTARLYPINTGGMPIISLLPVGIVSYETMMLFAVLSGVAGLLIETRKARRSPVDLSKKQSLSDEEILVIVEVGTGKSAQELRAIDPDQRIDP